MEILNDATIRGWIRENQRVQARCDGRGLYVRYRLTDAAPRWFLRYQLRGKPRTIHLGTFNAMGLADARRTAEALHDRIAKGIDVAVDRKEISEQGSRLRGGISVTMTVSDLIDEFIARQLTGRLKHVDVIRRRMDRNLKAYLGSMRAADVSPLDVDRMLLAIRARGAPTMAQDVLRWSKRVFAYALKREYVSRNPAAAFGASDAGGQRKGRDRWLTIPELRKLFAAMALAEGWPREYRLAISLLLMLGVRKGELLGAAKAELDLPSATWDVPAERTKTGFAITVPLPRQAILALSELCRLSGDNPWLFPARTVSKTTTTHIHLGTLNASASARLRPMLVGMRPFCIHDLRRTTRTQLEALGTASAVAERCLNHRVSGISGIYNRHDYFEERKEALQRWADVLEQLGA
jgi:integrase